MIESGSLRLLLSLARLSLSLARRALRSGRSSALRHLGAEQTQRLRLRRIEIDAGIGEDLGSDSLLLPQQAKEQVLCAYVPVREIASLAHGELENFLGAGCIG